MSKSIVNFSIVNDSEFMTDSQKISNLYEIVCSLKADLTDILCQLENRIESLES